MAIDRPRTVVTAEPAAAVNTPSGLSERYAKDSIELLNVSGIDLDIETAIPRHMGLGSGTQLALAIHTAIARAHDRSPDLRENAPMLDRGGRSGIGVGTFEAGGFLIDAGHASDQFTPDRPPTGSWTVPPISARHPIPDHWRFLLVIPDMTPGRSEADEDASMRSIVESADSAVADEIASVVLDHLLPGLATERISLVGEAMTTIDRLNGRWFESEQGGRHRPATRTIVELLRNEPAIFGTGQSSWGPTIYGLTDSRRESQAKAAGEAALEELDCGGRVRLAQPRNTGATVAMSID